MSTDLLVGFALFLTKIACIHDVEPIFETYDALLELNRVETGILVCMRCLRNSSLPSCGRIVCVDLSKRQGTV